MKREKIFRKIGSVVLTAAIMAGMGALVFVTEDNSKITAYAATGSTGTWSSSCSSTTGDSSEPHRTAEQKVSERFDREISKAAISGESIVKIDGSQYGINTLSRDMIKQLSNAGMNAEFSFDYEGNHYIVTIPAGATPISDDTPWYGPMYLMSLYGDTAVVTPLE